ncbi:MAG: hypothetical protein WBW33_21525 [Bryobacteraceae bacterium]
MSEENDAPERIAVIWSPEARADLRAIERGNAMQILHCVARYLANRTGDVKKLKPPLTGFRLRCRLCLSALTVPVGRRMIGLGADLVIPAPWRIE